MCGIITRLPVAFGGAELCRFFSDVLSYISNDFGWASYPPDVEYGTINKLFHALREVTLSDKVCSEQNVEVRLSALGSLYDCQVFDRVVTSLPPESFDDCTPSPCELLQALLRVGVKAWVDGEREK